jgi:biotin carboxyl carrier protein
MKKYKVIANGVEYEVQIELISDDDAQVKKTEKEPEKTAPSGAAGAVKAPLTGTVTTVNVKAGDAVKKGQVLMILEAMKMENEILALSDCTVKEVLVSAGKQVEAGDTLCVTG